jgi:hypothetical protein
MGNRLMRRDRKTVAAEWVRAMLRRLDQLQTLGQAGRLRVALDAPIFWGYRRELVLRADVMRRNDAARLREVLQLVQKREDCKRKDFMRYDKQTRRWEKWNHTPRRLSIREYGKLSPDLKCYFHPTWSYQRGWRYEVAYDWMFTSRRYKLYLTHRFIPDAEVLQEEDYLVARLHQPARVGILVRETAGRNRWKHRRGMIDKYVHAAKGHRLEIADGLECHAGGLLDWARGKEVSEDAKA